MIRLHCIRHGMLTATITAVIWLASGATLFAQISPGKLSRYHAELEGVSNCTKCHELGKDVSSVLCLDCHIPIKSRIERREGYHSSDDVRDKGCIACHSEHQGVDYEPVYWPSGKESFDHSKTGFPLKGKHRTNDCRHCHQRLFIQATDVITKNAHTDLNRTYLGVDKGCANCHYDEHQTQLGTDCQKCHGFDSFAPAIGFSHNNTPYPLTGKHQAVDCAKCHKSAATILVPNAATIMKKTGMGTYLKFAGLQYDNCTPCHEDKHQGKLGKRCADCHTTSGFRQVAANAFDHATTGYPLKGKHRNVTCTKCHTSGSMTTPVEHDACSDCHADAHSGQFAFRPDKGECSSCHTVEGFVPARFDIPDHQKGKYPLTGSHLAIPCDLCHKPDPNVVEVPGKVCAARFTIADHSCRGCHADPHGGQLNKWITKSGCEYCHNTNTWIKCNFDHDLANYKLLGEHRNAACGKCHKEETVGDVKVIRFTPLKQKCCDCHEDVHDGQFVRQDIGENVTDCARCHTPNGFKILSFDHNRDSRYKLTDAHLKVACSGCHKPVKRGSGKTVILYRPLGTECADCHKG